MMMTMMMKYVNGKKFMLYLLYMYFIFVLIVIVDVVVPVDVVFLTRK